MRNILRSAIGAARSLKMAHTSTLHVGDRAPDADLFSPDGAKSRLFDAYLGPQFTAIAYGDTGRGACAFG